MKHVPNVEANLTMRLGPLHTTAGPPPMTLTMNTATPTDASTSKPELRELSLRRRGS